MIRMPARRLLAALLLVAAPTAAGARTLTVNDAGADCASPADYTTIQAAVLAAVAERATRIHVCPGTYAEQVRVEGFRRLTLVADPGARVEPPGPVATGGIVEVIDSRRVEIRGFEIGGAGQFSGADLFVYGIYFRDSSGAIEGNVVEGIRPEPFTPSFAHAIHVVDTDPADDERVSIRIRDNVLQDYGQMGIDVSDAASVRVEDNIVEGVGPTAEVAQLGVILRRVARGRVRGNSIGGNWYTPYRAAAGLVLEDSSRVRVEGNALDENYEGIAVSGDSHRNRIADNDLTETLFALSIQGLPGAPAERNQATRNRMQGSGGAGVTALEIGDAARTRVSANELAGFGNFVEDLGTDTKLSKNSCNGAPCP